MKTKTIIFTLVVLSAVMLSACAPTGGLANAADKRTVSVNGTGIVTLTPDMATVQIGVQTEDEDADKAVDVNSTQVRAVMEAIKEFGIEDENGSPLAYILGESGVIRPAYTGGLEKTGWFEYHTACFPSAEKIRRFCRLRDVRV